MTNREGFAAGLIGGFLAGLFGRRLKGKGKFRTLDTNEVFLRKVNGACIVFSKTSGMFVKKDKWAEWHVTNQCGSEQFFSIGNFRKVSSPSGPETPSGAETCTVASTDQNPNTYPFKKQEFADRQIRVADRCTEVLQLKVKKHSELPSGPLYYLYDMCLGQNGQHKQTDPRIMIDD